jgi:hypothetical protein
MLSCNLTLVAIVHLTKHNMQINIFVLLSILFASTQVGAQVERWSCECTTNGVEDLGASVNCCNLVGGTFDIPTSV